MISRFEALRLDMTLKYPKHVAGAGMNAIAMIEDRITQEGRNAKGSALKPYSKAYLKFKQNPQLTQRGKDLGLGSSRFSGKTDYMLTGAFWRDIQLRELRAAGNNINVTIGPSADVNFKIMQSLTKRDGFPLTLSDTETEILQQELKVNLINIVEKHFPTK